MMEDNEYIEGIQGDLNKSLARIDFLMKEIQSYKKQNNICDISIKSHIDNLDSNYIHNIVDKARKNDKNKQSDIQKYDIQKYDIAKNLIKYNYICLLYVSILFTISFFIYILNNVFI